MSERSNMALELTASCPARSDAPSCIVGNGFLIRRGNSAYRYDVVAEKDGTFSEVTEHAAVTSQANTESILTTMKILFTADVHGYDKAYLDFATTLKLNNYDVGVLGGDLMTFPSERDLRLAKQELESEGTEIRGSNGENDPAVVQRALLNKQNEYKQVLHNSGRPIVFVMGNDDGLLGNGSAWSSEKGIVDINQRRATLGTYNFVGYHYTSPFIGGTFEKSESQQTKDFDKLSELIDENTVLVTHGPPWGILDTAFDGKNVGSKALRRLVDKKAPRIHLFGHIHRTFGIQGIYANGAYPASRKFIGVNVDTRELCIIDLTHERKP